MASDGCTSDVKPVLVVGSQFLRLGSFNEVNPFRNLQLSRPTNTKLHTPFKNLSINDNARNYTISKYPKVKKFLSQNLLFQKLSEGPHKLVLVNILDRRWVFRQRHDIPER